MLSSLVNDSVCMRCSWLKLTCTKHPPCISTSNDCEITCIFNIHRKIPAIRWIRAQQTTRPAHGLCSLSTYLLRPPAKRTPNQIYCSNGWYWCSVANANSAPAACSCPTSSGTWRPRTHSMIENSASLCFCKQHTLVLQLTKHSCPRAAPSCVYAAAAPPPSHRPTAVP